MYRRVMFGFLLSLSFVSFAQTEAIEFPTPTGPYQVGSTYRHWVDESRDETLTDDPDDKRELLVRFWYPAEVGPDAEPMPLMPHAAVQLPQIDRFLSGLGGYIERVEATQSYTYLDAPLAESDTRFPVLVFSHAPYTIPEIFTAQMEALASHGYVVAAIYHTYIAPATVFPDGRVAEHLSLSTVTMVADVQSVMDLVELLDADDPEGLFTSRLELGRFGVFGMSGGGRAADEVCRMDDRCAAYANEDGGPIRFDWTRETLPPAMFMSSSDGVLARYYERWDAPAYHLKFTKFVHVEFSDAPLWQVFAAMGRFESVQMVNAYLVAFFDKYLKGIDSPLLDGPSPDYPDIEFESRNIE